jgi:tripartite motif-containing protein 71
MKRMLIVFLFTGASLNALLFGISCSNQTPNSAFIVPLQTVASTNPPWTNTWTPTFTPTPTITPTPIPYPVGGFSTPYALAIDSKNNIYVGDTGNNLIKQFIGGYQNTNWPSGKIKSNGLAYTSPKSIATDSSGNLYVVGNGNAVSKYDTFGNYVIQYTASMSGPWGVAVSGNPATILYVSDSGNGRIISIALPGGASSVFEGSLSFTPFGLAVDSFGNLYVAGSDNSVHSYTSAGAVGTPVSVPGFNHPYTVALDANNNLYVSDTQNGQIEEFAVGNYSNSPVNIIGKGSLVNPEGIALDSSANVYVMDSGNSELFQFP